jgi:hypothetical protein
MKGEFTHNHYVPEWYQKRFLLPGKGTYHYLDLNPEKITHDGHTYTRRAILPWGPVSCFAQDDLYTTQWGSLKNTDIEKYFFGEIDRNGQSGLEFFTDFEIREGLHEAFENLLRYMSIQKLRTPKGLGFLSKAFGISDRNRLLMTVQKLQAMYCAIWTDSVWQIADATGSSTKFIISDHPVTVYNRGCFPGSKYCLGFNDPDIRYVATHTYFPMSLNKILIFTNLSWVRNPYQKENTPHPNQDLFHQGVFNATSIQKGRVLTENEVREINYITKMRALRYVAGAEKDWLFPEKYLKSRHWSKFGEGYLLMPEPRDVHMGGEMFFGFDNGRSEAFNEYRHRPWQRAYKDNARDEREAAALRRFQGEFALMVGKQWRGWSEQFSHKGPRVDSDDYYKYVVSHAPARQQKKQR